MGPTGTRALTFRKKAREMVSEGTEKGKREVCRRKKEKRKKDAKTLGSKAAWSKAWPAKSRDETPREIPSHMLSQYPGALVPTAYELQTIKMKRCGSERFSVVLA